MRRVVGAIGVEHDERGCGVEFVDVLTLELAPQSIQLATSDLVLPTRQRRLRGQRAVRVTRMLDRRIVAKPIGIVAVLVAERDLIDALAKLLATVMAPTLGVAVVFEKRGELAREADALVDLPQQQDAAVGRDVGRVAAQDERFALELKRDRWNTVCRRHGCSSIGVATLGTARAGSGFPLAIEFAQARDLRSLFVVRNAARRRAPRSANADQSAETATPSRIIRARP